MKKTGQSEITTDLMVNNLSSKELKKHYKQGGEQLANWLEVMKYLEKAQYTKVWHEQVADLMKKFHITSKELWQNQK